MRKALAAFIAAFLLFGVVSPALAASGDDIEVHTFGYTPERQRQAQDISWVLPVFEDISAGKSHSQPLVVTRPDGSLRVALMSGNEISWYSVSPDRATINFLRADPINGSAGASRGHTTYDPEDNLLISTTAHGWVTYHDLDTMLRVYQPTNLQSTEGAVSAPLVMEWQGEKIVVVGSKDGNVYLITDFKTGNPVPHRIHIGGILTSSPGPLPDGSGFIIGSDMGNQGKVAVIRFADVLEKAQGGSLRAKTNPSPQTWSHAGNMAGVPASFAMDGWIAYFSDARGTFYALDTRSMTAKWVNSKYRHPQTLVNRSPALDANHVYFTMQENGRYNNTGALVVLDKNTGQTHDYQLAGLSETYGFESFPCLSDPEFYSDPLFSLKPVRISTAPAVTSNHVFLGLESGHLFAYEKTSAQWLAPEGDDQGAQAAYFWSNNFLMSVGTGTKEGKGFVLQGLSSEISLAQDMLIFNCDPGTTRFYQTGDANFYIKELDPGTDQPEVGETYTGRLVVGADEKRLDKAVKERGGFYVPLTVHVNDELVDLIVGPAFADRNHPHALEINDMLGLNSPGIAKLPIMPGEEIELTFSWTAGSEETEIIAEINPALKLGWDVSWHRACIYAPGILHVGENTYADNKKVVTVKPQLPDLHVKALDPGTTQTDQGQRYTGSVTFGCKPDYKNPVTAKLILTHNDFPVSEVNGKTITLEPGGEQSFSFNFTGAGKDSVLKARIEPTGIDDAYWPDNEKTVTVPGNKIDLATKIIRQPSGLRKDEKATFTAEITSTAAEPITTSVRWGLTGNPISPQTQTITVPAGGKVQTTWSFTMFETDYGERIQVYAEANPNRNQPPNEITWSNNRSTVSVKYVTPDQDKPDDGGLDPIHGIPDDWFDR